MEFNVENYLSNLSYINKDFPSLWNEILEVVPKLTNKWLPSEANESDPLVVLLKELAVIADKLNYNIDKNILELFPATLTQLRSAYNVYESLGYTPDWYVSATTGVTITYTGMVSSKRLAEGQSTDPITIPKWTQVSDDDNEIVYTLMADVVDKDGNGFTPGTPGKITVPAMEGTLNDFEINGSTQITISNLDAQNRLYFNETNVAQNGIIISNFPDFSDYNYQQMLGTDVDEENTYEYYNKWRRVENLNQYTAGNRIYKLGIDSVTNNVYIQFPDDIGTLINDGLYIKYILSSGSEGNIGKGDLSQFLNLGESVLTSGEESGTAVTLQGSDFVIMNTKSAQNGTDPLDIEEMRREFNKTVGVFNTLVTIRDYENYLYEYEDNNGDHVVSNIRVSDRLNDLQHSITYKTMNDAGEFSDESETLSWTEGSGYTQTTKQMTAYDLRLYPLSAVSPIESGADFDNTFVWSNADSYMNTIEPALENAKCISHDFTDDGKPVLIPYDLNGQIYLQSVVSQEEATEIADRINLKVLQTLNARELEWGEMVDYGTVVDNIKAADNRIQYVALDAIEYQQPTELPEQGENCDLVVRNILAGNKAWTTYDNLVYDYNQQNAELFQQGTVINPGGADEAAVEGITAIETDVKITEPEGGQNGYRVGLNETFSVLTPQYNADTTYGNYLYYIAKTSNITDNPIGAGVPYKLAETEYIYFFETRDDAKAYINGDHSKAAYTLSPGTIIKPSQNLTFLAALNEKSVVNMGGAITIDTLTKASGLLRTSDNIASSTQTSQGLRFATNSQSLIDSLTSELQVGADGQPTNTPPYTLLSEEYLFYTDDLGIELGVVGEGTTIYSNTKFSEGDITCLQASSTKDLLNGSSSGDGIWTDVISSNTKITYELNELTTFGSNFLIRFCTKDVSKTTDAEGNIEYSTKITDVNVKLADTVNAFKNLSSSGVDTIMYLQLDESGKVPTDPTWTELSQTLDGDPYSVLIRLSLTTGLGVSQTLQTYDAEKFEVTGGTETATIAVPQTSQVVRLSYITNKDATGVKEFESADDTLISLQSDKLVSYQGGAALKLVDDEQEIVFYQFDYGEEGAEGTFKLTYDDTGFADLNLVQLTTSPTTLTIPGVINTAAVVPFISEDASTTVKYLLMKSGSSITLTTQGTAPSTYTRGAVSYTSGSAPVSVVTGIIKLGRPYVAAVGATYYDAAAKFDSSILNILKDGETDISAKVLDAAQLYRSSYSPIYQPNDQEVIDDPTKASSYFLDQHPYNRYVLPKLNKNNLTISPLSITN